MGGVELDVTSAGFKQISVLRRRLHDWNTTLQEFALWKATLRRIEGRYGSAVYSFFKFMKWAMALNISLTVLVSLIYVPGLFAESKRSYDCNISAFTNINDNRMQNE